MKRVLLITSLVFIMILAGCSTQVPPANPNNFGMISDVSPYECNSTTEARIYYNNVTHMPKICNSTEWINMTG